MDPRSLQFPSYIAIAKLSRDGDTRAAGELLDPIVSKHGLVAIFRGEVYIMERDYEAVRKLLPNLRAFPNIDTLQYYVVRCTASYFDGDHATAKLFADSALTFLNDKKAADSSDAQMVAAYASVLAMLERREEALRTIDKAVSMTPVAKDALMGADIRNARMIIYIAVGDFEAAIRELEFLMSVPSNITPAILRLHPGFDPLRDNPRFKKLAEEKVSS
jgi:tetratricopeptide (TPR) repeat protein